MEPNRNLMMGIGLILAALSTIPIALYVLEEPHTISVWFTVIIGLMLSIPLYIYVAWSRHNVKKDKRIPQKTTGSLYRYLIPSVIVGLLLGQVAWYYLSNDLQEAILLVLSGWMFGTMCFLVFVAWRFAPKE